MLEELSCVRQVSRAQALWKLATRSGEFRYFLQAREFAGVAQLRQDKLDHVLPQATARKNRVARCLRARAIGHSPHRPKFPILKCPATPSMTPRAAPVGVAAPTRPGQFVCGSVGAICMVRSGSQCYPSGRFCSSCSGPAKGVALWRLREGLVRPKMKKEQRECLGDVWSEGGDDTEHRGVLTTLS